jgi:hypothetical protein
VGALTGAGTGAGLPANGTVSGPAHGWAALARPGHALAKQRPHVEPTRKRRLNVALLGRRVSDVPSKGVLGLFPYLADIVLLILQPT